MRLQRLVALLQVRLHPLVRLRRVVHLQRVALPPNRVPRVLRLGVHLRAHRGPWVWKWPWLKVPRCVTTRRPWAP